MQEQEKYFERLKGLNRRIAEAETRRNNLVIEAMHKFGYGAYHQFEAEFLKWSRTQY